jgi:hypothetical protein
MIIHLIGSKRDIKSNYKYYDKIRNSVIAAGHTIAHDWLDKEYTFITSGNKHVDTNWKKINDENMAALSRADIVIAEASARSFSTGFQVATAIQQKKPVLILTRNNELAGSFGSGIISDFVHTANYTINSVDGIIADFINENNIDNKDLRFNFFIDRQIHNYLRWAAYKTGKNKSEILRELILREIEKKDN